MASLSNSATAASSPLWPLDAQTSTRRPDQAMIDSDLRRLKECVSKLSAVKKDSPGLNPHLMATVQAALDALFDYTANLENISTNQIHDVTLHPDFLDSQPATRIYVDTTLAVIELVHGLVRSQALAVDTDLFLDTEQDPFDRTSWLQIYVASSNVVYLVDVLTLGQTAFTTEAAIGETLQAILESSTIKKCFYDVRGDSYALFREFGIRTNGLEDLALWAAAAYGGKKQDHAISLLSCIEQYCKHWFLTSQREEWVQVKRAGGRTWKETAREAGEMGPGESEEWTPPINVRPLPIDLEKYCAGDVTVMPIIRKQMMKKVEQSGRMEAWKKSIEDLTLKRTVASQVPEYSISREEAVAGPVEWQQSKGPHLT